MRAAWLSAFAMALTACASAPAAPAPMRLPDAGSELGALRPDAASLSDRITVNTERYSFDSVEPDALLAEMRNSAQSAGIAMLGRTDWNVSWTYDYAQDAGQCAAENVQTSLTVDYVLPDWQPRSRPSDALRQRYAVFSAAVEVHEYGHALIGYRAMQDIQLALSTSAVRHTDCARVGKALNAKARDIIARASREGDAYDRDTGHGKTQGAFLDLGGLE